MKLYSQEKAEKQMLKKIKEALDNMEGLNLSNTLKAEAIFLNIQSLETKQEEKRND